MKKFFIFSMVALMALPAFSGTTKTTTSTYEETSSSPSEMIEAEEYDEPMSIEEADQTRMDEQQKMEERNQNSSTVIESEDAVDYSDRTRTNRERKALNTGSHASDDE